MNLAVTLFDQIEAMTPRDLLQVLDTDPFDTVDAWLEKRGIDTNYGDGFRCRNSLLVVVDDLLLSHGVDPMEFT